MDIFKIILIVIIVGLLGVIVMKSKSPDKPQVGVSGDTTNTTSVAATSTGSVAENTSDVQIVNFDKANDILYFTYKGKKHKFNLNKPITGDYLLLGLRAKVNGNDVIFTHGKQTLYTYPIPA